VKTRALIVLAAVAGAGLAALLGGALVERTPAPSPELAASQSEEDFKAGFALGDTASLVESLQTTLRATPSDEHSWTLLGLAYQQRARETGDPAYYTDSGGALERAVSLDPSDSFAYSGLGSLALSRHRFALALRLGRKARALAPDTARTLGVIGDAEIELGRYRLAFRDFDEMSRLRPDVSAYARVSYGRELLGHTAGAIRTMRLAVDAATDTAEPQAWAHVQLGKLYFNHGRFRAAERELRTANAIFPSYAYGLDAQALDEAALGHTRRAIALERVAVDLIPLPQYVAALGDLYATIDRPAG
jgi:tetratricopeptide (TPR) repeat protein